MVKKLKVVLGMKKYFQVQDYLGNMKARVSIFNMNGRASIWWEHLMKVKNINDRKIVWKSLRNISSRSTSLIGIMMIILKSSMS